MALAPKTATIGWDAVAGSTSYELLVDGKIVATAGSRARQAQFAITVGSHTIEVIAQPSGQKQGLVTTVGPA